MGGEVGVMEYVIGATTGRERENVGTIVAVWSNWNTLSIFGNYPKFFS